MNFSIAKYSFKSPRRQYFSLPFPIIWYLIETEFPHLLLKLHKTCKYFFAKKTIFVVDKHIRCVAYSNNTTFVVDPDDMKLTLPKPKKWWLTSLLCGGKKTFSTIRPYIYRVTLSKLCIWEEDLSLNDINILLSNDKMEELLLSKVNIRDANGTPVPIHYILGKVPNVTAFYYYNKCEIYSNQWLEKLNSINICTKLEWFSHFVSQTSEEIDAEILGQFVKNHLASLLEVHFRFPPNSREFETVNNKLKKVVKKWCEPNRKLKFTVKI